MGPVIALSGFVRSKRGVLGEYIVGDMLDTLEVAVRENDIAARDPPWETDRSRPTIRLLAPDSRLIKRLNCVRARIRAQFHPTSGAAVNLLEMCEFFARWRAPVCFLEN